MLVFLMLNKIGLDYTQNELSDAFLKIAAGELTGEKLFHWIVDHQI